MKRRMVERNGESSPRVSSWLVFFRHSIKHANEGSLQKRRTHWLTQRGKRHGESSYPREDDLGWPRYSERLVSKCFCRSSRTKTYYTILQMSLARKKRDAERAQPGDLCCSLKTRCSLKPLKGAQVLQMGCCPKIMGRIPFSSG